MWGRQHQLSAIRESSSRQLLPRLRLCCHLHPHTHCRQLCKLYDIFLADERILPSLPKLIGKAFFKVRGAEAPSAVGQHQQCSLAALALQHCIFSSTIV